MLYPPKFENKTGFAKIKEFLKTHCLSSLGKFKVDEIKFSTDLNKIVSELKQIAEFKQIILFTDNFPGSYFIDTIEYFKRTEKIGTYFTPEELFDINRSLNTIRLILNFFKNDTENKYIELRKISKKLSLFPYISKRINDVIDKNGKIKDNASSKLSVIRRDLSKKKSGVSGAVHRILEKAKKAGNVETDTELAVRDGKLLIPVASSNKRKINGYVYDESSTGQTSYIEPFEVIKLNNEIKELYFAEKREVIKVLTEITVDLRPYFNDLLLSYDFLAEIDFIRAKALFSISTEGESPLIIDKPVINFINATHPILFLSYKNTEKQVVSSNFKIDEEQRIIVISGPNAGGKSVALKSVGLLQYMVQCGIQVPVHQSSETGIFSNIFIDIGDEQSLENDLSTYSSHLVNMKYFVENCNERTLILIDEFGTGTEPLIGGAIAEAVLEEINKKKTKGIITTHYTNLKQYADETEGIQNGAMLFDSDKMLPLYCLETGKPGSSFAFEIAERTGFNRKILKNAESKVDKKQIDFEKVLKESQREKRNLKKEKRTIRNLRKELEEVVEKYESELDITLKKRKEILQTARLYAESILSSANKRIEKTIFEIKKTNAQKEKTKQLRTELDEFKEQENKKQQLIEEKINEKIEKIKQKKKKRKKQNVDEGKPQKLSDAKIRVGDIVKIKGQNTAGEVQKIKKKEITIAFGSMHTTIDIKRIEKLTVGQTEHYKKKQSSGVTVVRTSEDLTKSGFTAQLDVRGKRADEALQLVTQYIDDAIVNASSEIQILHGTGTGILRQVIREYLRGHELIKSYRDQRLEAGGAGITVASLDI